MEAVGTTGNSGDKSAIREQIRTLRRAMSPNEAARRSGAIIERAWELPELGTASAVLSYVSSLENEVETIGLIERLLHKGREVAVPWLDDNKALRWALIYDTVEFIRGAYGILEPAPRMRVPYGVPDDAVIIVPGIAFNAACHRIGFGGGYFDRLLASHKGASIGLAYDFQICSNWIPEPHDVPVSVVVTESLVYRQ